MPQSRQLDGSGRSCGREPLDSPCQGPDGSQADYSSGFPDGAATLLVRKGFPGRPRGLEGSLRKGRPWKEEAP